MNKGQTTNRIAHYFAAHNFRFVLCDDDGTELCDVPRERVSFVAHECAQAGRGYVKQIAIAKEVSNV